MDLKRKRVAYDDLEDSHKGQPYRKTKVYSSTIPHIDEITGQRGAIPCQEDNDTASAEAIAYLRSVRTEANHIPALLIAPREQFDKHEVISENGELDDTESEDSRGYYEDGVYAARRAVGVATDFDDSTYDGSQVPDAQSAYHKSLIRRFLGLRTRLNSPPAKNLPKGLCVNPNRHRIDQRLEIAKWTAFLLAGPPSTTQLAFMSQESVAWILLIVPDMMHRLDWMSLGPDSDYTMLESTRNLSAWIWGLLARMQDLDTLDSEEVSLIRDLAKTAGTILLGLKLGRMQDFEGMDWEFAAEVERRRYRRNTSSPLGDGDSFSGAKEDEEVIEEDGIGAVLEVAKAKLSGTVTNGDARSKHDSDQLSIELVTRGTLDLILTVAGECYGQTDLLVARKILWDCQ